MGKIYVLIHNGTNHVLRSDNCPQVFKTRKAAYDRKNIMNKKTHRGYCRVERWTILDKSK